MKRKTGDASESETGGKNAKMKFDKETVNARGFCTQPDMALPMELVEAVTSGTTTHESGHEILIEKDLLGTGRSKKELHMLRDDSGNDNEAQAMLVSYYTGKRFVKNDRERTLAFFEAARKAKPECADAQAYLLLAAASGICKRNALPDLCDAGIVVQRE
jgi:hypothetical protein